MTTYVLDSETTGLTAKDQVIELAYHNLPTIPELLYINKWLPEQKMLEELQSSNLWFNQRFNPTVPIHPKAYEVHKISKLALIKEPSSLKASSYLPKDVTYLVGHLSLIHI